MCMKYGLSINLCCIYNSCVQREAKGFFKANLFLHRLSPPHSWCVMNASLFLACSVVFLFACPRLALYLPPRYSLPRIRRQVIGPQSGVHAKHLTDCAVHRNEKASHVGGFCERMRWAAATWTGQRIGEWSKFNVDGSRGAEGTPWRRDNGKPV